MASSRKIEYSWPLLDVRLVRLFLSIPSEENYYRGMGRYLHRRAIDGVVPEMVAWKQGKYMGPVNIDDQLNAAGELIAVSGLHPAIEEFVDMGKLEEQITELSHSPNNIIEGSRKLQLNMNIRAVSQVNAWMKHIQPVH